MRAKESAKKAATGKLAKVDHLCRVYPRAMGRSGGSEWSERASDRYDIQGVSEKAPDEAWRFALGGCWTFPRIDEATEKEFKRLRRS